MSERYTSRPSSQPAPDRPAAQRMQEALQRGARTAFSTMPASEINRGEMVASRSSGRYSGPVAWMRPERSAAAREFEELADRACASRTTDTAAASSLSGMISSVSHPGSGRPAGIAIRDRAHVRRRQAKPRAPAFHSLPPTPRARDARSSPAPASRSHRRSPHPRAFGANRIEYGLHARHDAEQSA